MTVKAIRNVQCFVMAMLVMGELTVRDSLDLGGRSDRLIGSHAAFGVNQVGCEDSVNQGRFSKARLS